MSLDEQRFETLRGRLTHRVPDLKGYLELLNGVNRRKIERTSFRDLTCQDPNGLHIQFQPIDEIVELLDSTPQEDDFEPNPKSINWYDDECPDINESPLFNEFSVFVTSSQKKKAISCKLDATVRKGATASRLTKLKNKLLLDALQRGSLTYDGEEVVIAKHHADGKGIAFNLKLPNGLNVFVEFSEDCIDDQNSKHTALNITVSSKPSVIDAEDDDFKNRIKSTLESSSSIFNVITSIFTEAYATSAEDPFVLSMPINKLRNQQQGKHSHTTVEPPEVIGSGEDAALFKQIARIPEKLNFEVVGGLEKQIDELRRLIVVAQNQQEFARRGIQSPNAVIFHGPPGTGKTLLAEIAARELGGYFFKIDCSDILNKWVGESEARIRSIFRILSRISQEKPVTIFFDEFDVLGRKKHSGSPEWTRSITNTILTSMNELPKNCLALAAVNNIDDLEPAIKREGRFSQIHIPLPDINGRAQIVQNWVDHFNRINPENFSDVDCALVAKMTEGMSGADLFSILSKSLSGEIFISIKSGQPMLPLGTEKILETLRKHKELIAESGTSSVGLYL